MIAIFKKYLTGVGIIALAFSYNIGQANSAECVMPTCATLGYTTSKSACALSNYLTCPFDTTQVYCPDCSSYPLSKAKCNSSYGTCEACPYNNSKYKYSSCKTNRLVDDNGLCRCDRSKVKYQYVEEGGHITIGKCTDDTGTYTNSDKCWTNAKVNTGSACVRTRLNLGDVFMWGGAPIGIVLKDDGSKITVMSMFYVSSGNVEGNSSNSYIEGSQLTSTTVNYVPSACTRNGSKVAPTSYRPNSQYDPVCQNSSLWRLPTFEEAVLMGGSGSGTLGFVIDPNYQPTSGSPISITDLVYNAVGGGAYMNKWFPTDPAGLGPVTVMDTEMKCYYSGKSLHIVNIGGMQGVGGNCRVSSNPVVNTETDCTANCSSTRFPVRPVMDITIQ